MVGVEGGGMHCAKPVRQTRRRCGKHAVGAPQKHVRARSRLWSARVALAPVTSAAGETVRYTLAQVIPPVRASRNPFDTQDA